MSNCCEKCESIRSVEKDMRRRIIALTGKDQYSLELIQNYLTSKTNVFKVNKVTSHDLTTDEFLNKIIKGDIIEASCDEKTGIIVGTSKASIEPGFLYVGIYTPHQLSNLLEYQDKNLEVLPIEIELTPKQLLDNLCERMGSVYEACEEYIKIEQTYEGEEFLDTVVILWRHYATNKELYNELGKENFEWDVKQFNKTNNLITDLDNFI